jgi:Pentapeptide repeats (8 copies)
MPEDVVTLGLAVLAALLLAMAIWWVWWRLPRREAARLALKIRDAKARADVEDNFRKTVGQALGGAAVLIGAFSAYLQFSQQQRSSHDLLISNQVSKGFEQLGSEKLVVRLGGIYALEGVMNTSDRYHRSVLEELSAFVREGAKYRTPPISDGSCAPLGDDRPPVYINDKPPADIQAALAVIGRRSADQWRVNLVRVGIAGADLSHANLTDADLERADLIRADLRGANLTRAHLSCANLRGADLQGADLTDADLAGVDLRFGSLNGANLSGAELTGADVRFAAEGQQQLLNGACGLAVKLPPGLTLKPCPGQ